MDPERPDGPKLPAQGHMTDVLYIIHITVIGLTEFVKCRCAHTMFEKLEVSWEGQMWRDD